MLGEHQTVVGIEDETLSGLKRMQKVLEGISCGVGIEGATLSGLKLTRHDIPLSMHPQVGIEDVTLSGLHGRSDRVVYFQRFTIIRLS
jgi:hypothetical protein